MSTRIQASGKVRAGSAKGGDMEFVVSTDQVARDGMIIRKGAWKNSIARAAENEQFLPKFTIAHMHAPLPDGSPPVLGTIVNPRWVEGEGLVASVRWADPKVQPAVSFWRKGYEDGVLTDVSVEWGNSKFAEGADRQSDAPEIVDLTWDAVSACVIGADAGAKKRAVESGNLELARMLEAEEVRAATAATTRAVVTAMPVAPSAAAAPQVTPDAKRLDRGIFIGATAAGERNVIKDFPGCPAGKPWALVAKHDGKILGCHGSEAEAQAQEAAIQANAKAAPEANARAATPVAPIGGVVLDGHVEITPGGGITVDPAGEVPAPEPVLTAREVLDTVTSALARLGLAATDNARSAAVESRLAKLEAADVVRAQEHAARMAEVRGALEELRAAKVAPQGEAAGTPPSAAGRSAADADAREGSSYMDVLLNGVGEELRRAANSIQAKVAAASL